MPTDALNSLIIGVDDTDTVTEGGTGRLCRGLAEVLSQHCRVRGVTRHQLAILPGIPYTRKNSANAVHLLCAPNQGDDLLNYATDWVAEHALASSEPGLCQGSVEALATVRLGRSAQRRVVTIQEARKAAQTAQVTLRALSGKGHGIVGALAAANLASTGNDGRFVTVGHIRELHGLVSIAEVQAAGVEEIRTTEGQTVTTGEILVANGLRPALCANKPVLFVVPGKSYWLPIKGWPRPESSEQQTTEVSNPE